MIHVVCLNPAVDKLYRIDNFTAGEDYPGQRPISRVGGKGVNVARVLSQLGEAPTLYAFLGETGGELVRREMEARCTCRFFSVPGACRSTINIIDRQNDRETVVTEAGPEVSPADVRALLDALSENLHSGDIVCCSGSIIAGAPADIYAQIAALSQARGAKCALDANVRALSGSLEARYLLGKPNERELAALLGEKRTTEPKKIAAMARRLMPPFDALLVSMGGAGGVYVSRSGAYAAEIPRVEVVSTVGSGDASFAGALAAMARGETGEELLRLSMACGAANAALGQVGSVEPDMVRQLAERIQVRRVEASEEAKNE